MNIEADLIYSRRDGFEQKLEDINALVEHFLFCSLVTQIVHKMLSNYGTAVHGVKIAPKIGEVRHDSRIQIWYY